MIRLTEETSKLKKMLFEIASSVEEMIAKSIKALEENNMILAEDVIKSDEKVNEMEIEIDNQCIRILALHHPEAEDLRTVTMIMKINNDLDKVIQNDGINKNTTNKTTTFNGGDNDGPLPNITPVVPKLIAEEVIVEEPETSLFSMSNLNRIRDRQNRRRSFFANRGGLAGLFRVKNQ